MHGEDFDALDRKRRVDDVIVMAALRARILAGLNAVETASIGRIDPEQQRKNDFLWTSMGECLNSVYRKREYR